MRPPVLVAFLVGIALLALGGSSANGVAPDPATADVVVRDAQGREVVKDSYIVLLVAGIPADKVGLVAQETARRHFGRIEYLFTTLPGFSIHMTAEQARLVANEKSVAHVQPNYVVHAD